MNITVVFVCLLTIVCAEGKGVKRQITFPEDDDSKEEISDRYGSVGKLRYQPRRPFYPNQNFRTRRPMGNNNQQQANNFQQQQMNNNNNNNNWQQQQQQQLPLVRSPRVQGRVIKTFFLSYFIHYFFSLFNSMCRLVCYGNIDTIQSW